MDEGLQQEIVDKYVRTGFAGVRKCVPIDMPSDFGHVAISLSEGSGSLGALLEGSSSP
jgi:hypothetical protein